MVLAEYTVTVTEDDVRFLEQVQRHYQLFAEATEKQGDKRATGIVRKQEFYAERMLERIRTPTDSEGEERSG